MRRNKIRNAYHCTAMALLISAVPSIANGEVGNTTTFLGIELDQALAESAKRCESEELSDSQPCFSEVLESTFIIKFPPNIGFAYELSASENDGAVDAVWLTAAAANAPFLLNLLKIRFGEPTEAVVDYSFSVSGKGESGTGNGFKWAGNNITIVFRPHSATDVGELDLLVVPSDAAREEEALFDARIRALAAKL